MTRDVCDLRATSRRLYRAISLFALWKLRLLPVTLDMRLLLDRRFLSVSGGRAKLNSLAKFFIVWNL